MTEETIFALALEQLDATSQAAFLARACGEDESLRQRVEALLRTHEKVGDFLNKPVVEQLAAPGDESDVTHAFNTSNDPKGSAMTRTAGEGSSDEQDTPLGFLQPSARPDSLGRIGHYEMLQILGKGGFGIVFRAFDDMLQRVVAVKVMAPHLAAASPARKRFLREARSSAQVRHENVVQIYEVGEQPLPYLVMEFIPGETLQQKLDRNGPLDVSEILRIGRQIAEGLSAAHACDLIHRDIKPGNILLEGGSHKAKITDFGLARAADDASISQSGVIAGTPMFMAPEQALGQQIDQRADLFSLGSVLYQMASGRPPFRAPTALAVLKRVAEESPRAIPEIIPETPDWLCGIIAKLHAKNPDDRFQSARELADLLADCEAKLKTKQEVKNVFPAAVKPAGRNWVAAAALLLLPVIALAVTEVAGLTHLFRAKQATHDSIKPASDPSEVVVLKKEPHVAAAKLEPPPLAIAPFDATQAKKHQEAWANHLGVPVEFENSIGMKLKLIPPGEFLMGASEEERPLLEAEDQKRIIAKKDKPPIPNPFYAQFLRMEPGQHAVTLTKPYRMGMTEVTVGQFRKFIEAAGYKTIAEIDEMGGQGRVNGVWRHNKSYSWKDLGEIKITDAHAVVNITKEDADAFCYWLSHHEKKDYRLPTEAEWEYACRGGTTTIWHFGNDPAVGKEFGNVGLKNFTMFPAPAGSFKPNAFGLFDMYGGASECVQDGYAPYSTERVVDPVAKKGQQMLARGGMWSWGPEWCRSSMRIRIPDARWGLSHSGFRVVMAGDLTRQR